MATIDANEHCAEWFKIPDKYSTADHEIYAYTSTESPSLYDIIYIGKTGDKQKRETDHKTTTFKNYTGPRFQFLVKNGLDESTASAIEAALILICMFFEHFSLLSSIMPLPIGDLASPELLPPTVINKTLAVKAFRALFDDPIPSEYVSNVCRLHIGALLLLKEALKGEPTERIAAKSISTKY